MLLLHKQLFPVQFRLPLALLLCVFDEFKNIEFGEQQLGGGFSDCSNFIPDTGYTMCSMKYFFLMC